MKIKKIRSKEDEVYEKMCKNKRHYIEFKDAALAMAGTNKRYNTNCIVYICKFCKLYAIGHTKKSNELQKEVNIWLNYTRE